MHVLITRPREDAPPLAATLREAGVESTSNPLLDIVYLNETLPDLAAVQGLLITSANGIRAFARLSPRRDLIVWVVGDASARMATELDFSDVHSASGDVDALAALVCEHADPSAGTLLHVAGTRLAGDLAGHLESAGFSYQRCILYEARTAEHLSAETAALLAANRLDGVLLYSPRTAALFGALVKTAGLQDALQAVTAFCLSPAVAAKIDDLPWERIAVAAAPHEASLIAEVLGV